MKAFLKSGGLWKKRLFWLMFTIVMVVFFEPVSPAGAAIYLGETRIIVNSREKEATLRVSNDSDAPVLLQVWVDTGDREAIPGDISVPFTITQPILRLDGKRSQRLRIIFTGEESQLAGDRESVFWLNVLEIPPKPRADPEKNRIQMVFRSRIKLFYRPETLRENTNIPRHQQLRFKIIVQNKVPVLQISNPTPFYQTLLELAVGQDRQRPQLSVLPDDGMVAPYQQLQLPVSQAGRDITRGMRVFYSLIDDFGNVLTGEQTLL
ncbi:molecular chaperone [Entomohabitans teleogrylli]|uniref:fimbrial biogenesis chaperone n=1 Tax=Entomohabitans teleogrylli TaxID=1384589 RepID=UPI00073D9BE6|nr:fimbria/pilus periplasmic chaperone [Entomohabitans teleogrylli]